MTAVRVCFECIRIGEMADPVPAMGTLDTSLCPRCRQALPDMHGFWYDVTAPTMTIETPRYKAFSADSDPLKSVAERQTDEAERSWPEDTVHENGNYQNQCSICDHVFQGYKGRRVCKACTAGIVRSPVFYSKEYEDLTLEEAKEVVRHGWRKVLGRTEMVLVRQIARLLSAQSASQIALIKVANQLRAYSPEGDEYKGKHIHKVWAKEIEAAVKGDLAAQSEIKPAECKCSLRIKLVGDGCEVCNPKLAEELSGQSGI